MIPLDSVVSLRETTAPQVISHFNLFRSAEITGNSPAGQSSGQTLQAMEDLARANLPPGFDFAWAGQSLEERRAGGQAGLIFGLSLLLVYLVLSAQYESFILPLIILLGVPLAVFGALSAQLLRGFNNDVFCQVGLVLLVGLAAKNSILIVEFAEQLRGRGLSIVDAAIEAGRIRLRPILMTSLAFILGVLPLALATGAGAAARNSVGTAVAGGMLASTFLSIVFIPVLYVLIRSLAPGRVRRLQDAPDPGSSGSTGSIGPAAAGAVMLALALSLATPAFAQARTAPLYRVPPVTQAAQSSQTRRAPLYGVPLVTQAAQSSQTRRAPLYGVPPVTQAAQPAMETVTFDEAIARALEKNPTIAIASTNILRSEAILQQVRASVMPRLGANITNTTLDSGRSFGDQTVQPQNQTVFGLSAAAPILAAAQWAAKAQALDQVEIARLATTDTRRQIAVATASAYLAVIAQKRQVEVSLSAIETARGQLDYNTRRREGGVGSRLNELRSAQILASNEAIVEIFRLNLRRAQEALGVLLAANAAVDVSGEPAFEVPAEAAEAEWMAGRTDVQLFTAERAASDRVLHDSSKDWWPAAAVTFGPQILAPSGIFQPSRTWSLSFQLAQPLYDAGSRRAVRRQREAAVQASTFSLEQVQIQARSEVRVARAAVEAQERALARTRQAAQHANEVLKITIVAFDAGSTTNIEVIDAQRSVRDLEIIVVQGEDAVRQRGWNCSSRLDVSRGNIDGP